MTTPAPHRPGRSTSVDAEEGYAVLSRVVRWWLDSPFVELDVVGLEHVPTTGRVVVASNHPSMLSTLVPWAVLGRNPAVLVLSRAFRVPVLGTVFRHLGNVPVPRDIGRPFARHRRLDRAGSAKAAVDVLRDEGAVQLYPEGTIPRRKVVLRRSELQQLEAGVVRIAATAGAPIVPVGMRLGWRFDRRGLRHTVVVRVGPPIVCGTTEEAVVLERVRSAIRGLSGLPYEEHDDAPRPEGLLWDDSCTPPSAPSTATSPTSRVTSTGAHPTRRSTPT